MFCKNCGKELENGVKFCDNCGTPQQVESVPASAVEPATKPAPQPVSQEIPQNNTVENTVPQGNVNIDPQPQYGSVPYNPAVPVTPKKKNNGCLIAAIIGIVIFVLIIIGIIALVVFSVNITKDVISNTEFDISEDINISDFVDEDVANAEYAEIFSSHNIVDVPPLFIGLDSRVFASVDEDGTIDKMEFGYSGDTIEELIETIYYPLTDVDESLIDDLDKSMKEAFADAEALDCCTIAYDTTTDYYVITIHSTDLDSATNLKSLSDAGVLVYDGFVTSLSMNETADGLVADGYIER